MALKLGELAAVIKTDDSEFEKGLDKAQGKFKGFGDKMKGSATAIGASAALALGVAMAGALDLGQAEARLGAQLGATPADAKRYGEVAGNLYKAGFGESMAGLADTVRAVISGGLIDRGAATADIEAVAKSAQILADTFGVDVAEAARAAGQMVKTGLAKDAGQAFDILTAGFQGTGDLAGDLLDTFSEYSTQFREVGISGPKAMGLLSQAVQGGARDLDTAADAIKEFAIRSQDGSAQAAAGFQALDLNAKTMTATFAKGGPEADKAMKLVLDRLKAMKDPIEQRAAAVALFGTKAEDLGDALYALDPSTATAALGDLEGGTKRAGDAMQDTASKKLEKFKRAVQTALVEKVSEAIPHLEKVGKWASENSGTLLTVGGVIAGIAVSVWAVNAAMAAWNAITTIATAVQWLLNIAMLANPIGLIVLAIIALVAGIYLLWENSAAFRDFWIAVWEGIKVAALAVWDFIVAAAKAWWAVFSGVWKAVGRFFVSLWGGIVDGVKAAWKWITDTFDKVVGFVGGLPKRLKAQAKGMWDGIKEAFKSAVNWIIGKWNSLSFRIPGLSVPGLGQVWGGATLSTPDLPYMATGGTTTRGGMAMVGERGREAVYLPAGASVQPNRYGGDGGRQEVLHRVRLEWPDGRTIREILIDYASTIGAAPADLLPTR